MSSSAIMKHLYGKKGSTDIKMDAKQLPRELYFLFGCLEAAEEELPGKFMKNDEEHR